MSLNNLPSVSYAARKMDEQIYKDAIMIGGAEFGTKHVVSRIRKILKELGKLGPRRFLDAEPWERVLKPVIERYVKRCWDGRVRFEYDPSVPKWRWEMYSLDGSSMQKCKEDEEAVGDFKPRATGKCYYMLNPDEVGFTMASAYKFSNKDYKIINGVYGKLGGDEAIVQIRLAVLMLLKQLHTGVDKLSVPIDEKLFKVAEVAENMIKVCWPKWAVKTKKEGSGYVLTAKPNKGFMSKIKNLYS